MPEQRAAAPPAQGDAEPEQSALQRVFKIGQVSFIGVQGPHPPNGIHSKSYWSGRYHNLVCDCIFHCYRIYHVLQLQSSSHLKRPPRLPFQPHNPDKRPLRLPLTLGIYLRSKHSQHGI
jgi:hypothetical protein